jgi:Zinc dependent phospholipase C
LSSRAFVGSVVLAAGMLLLAPHAAFAWGPATHTQIGLEILRSLDLFPTSISALLARYPIDFLYGSLAADISMAKKYAPVGRHCHHWHVAREIHRAAGDDGRLRAAMTGYLCHLAADVLAHNTFVPRMLTLTSSTRALGHSYWEHRMDVDVGPEYAQLARWIVTRFDHSGTDALFHRVLSSTLFTFSTNRRIFRGMIRISGNESWHSIFDTVIDNSRWDLDPTQVVHYQRYGFEMVADFLLRDEASRAAERDPIGDECLNEAKKIRRRVLLAGGWPSADAIRETADRHFPLPAGATRLWEERGGTEAEAAQSVERAIRDSGVSPLREIRTIFG